MKSLLAIEWMKLKKYRTFWVLICLLLPLWNFFIKSGILKIGGGGINVLSQVYSFTFLWENIGFWASMFVWFLSILTIIITTNEYQYRTNRQNVIDGWSRMDFYHAKWGVVVSLSVATTIYVFLAGMLIAVTNSGLDGFPGHIQYLFYVFVLCLNYYSFCLLVSIFFKRSGLAIGMFIFYCMIIETLLKFLINYFADGYGNYLPLQCSDELLPFPVLDMVKAMAQMKETGSPMMYVIASFVWIVIYYFVGKRKLEKSDW
jgi:ABC-2 type transport system permease protein